MENGNVSHGCVAAPDPFTDKLFMIAAQGDKVMITDGMLIGLGHTRR
jgi:hypothetical protein